MELANELCKTETMATDYTPDVLDAAALARFKRTHTAHEQQLREIKELAPKLMRQGATVGQLAKWTGLTDEVFRRIGRAHGIERLREPTVGKDAKPKQPDGE